MGQIDFLEFGGAREDPPGYVWKGIEIPFPDPRECGYQELLGHLQVGAFPGLPVGVADWKRRALFARWCAAWGLPSFERAQRLTYLVDHYRGAIVSDAYRFGGGVDVGSLWRDRRWLELLDFIDGLPGHSAFAAAVGSDEEHGRLLAEQYLAQKREAERSGQEEPQHGPPLQTWTPEVAMLAKLVDAVRALEHTVVAVQVGGDKAGGRPKPEPRPSTAAQRAIDGAQWRDRWERHRSLAARVVRPQG